MPLRAGDPVPDLPLRDATGEIVSLRGFGGDVLVDAGGIVRWIHRSRGPEDRPTLAALLRSRSAPARS